MARRKTETRTLTITRLIEVPIQVEIPIACPNCRTSFTEEDSLTEYQYGPGQQACYLPEDAPQGPDDPTVADYGAHEDIFEGSIVVGYACAKCGGVLASEEPTRTITPEIMRGLRFALANVMISDVTEAQARDVDMARAFVDDLQVPRG